MKWKVVAHGNLNCRLLEERLDRLSKGGWDVLSAQRAGKGWVIVANREEQEAKNKMTQWERELYEDRGEIYCIKEVRNRTGMSLKDAKEFVEKEAARLHLWRSGVKSKLVGAKA